MTSISPRIPKRPLAWTDTILDLHDLFLAWGVPCYIVGGAVRDAWLHQPIHDLDLATSQNAIALAKRIANHFDADVYVMDEERDVARVLLHQPDYKLTIDLARFRGTSLADDLHDRDFTVNAMAVDLLGDVTLLIDPLNGEADLDEKVIRQCNPNAIASDPVRAIRAVRQSIGLSARLLPETTSAIRTHGGNINQTSPERVRDEFVKLLDLPRPHSALRVLEALGLLAHIIPQTASLKTITPFPHTDHGWAHSLLMIEKLYGMYITISPYRTDSTAAVFDLGMIVTALDIFRPQLQAHIAHTWANDRSHKALLMLGGLLHLLSSEIVDNIAISLRLSNDEKKRLVQMVSAMPSVFSTTTDPLALHYFWRKHGDAGIDACLMALAHHLAYKNTHLKQDDWLMRLEHIQKLLTAYFIHYDQIVDPPLLLTGDALMAHFNLHPGKKIGELLKILREAQVLDTIHSKQDALNYLKDHL